MANFQQRIYDALGTNQETILSNLADSTQNDILTHALWTVARQIPAELLIPVSTAAAYTTANAGASDDWKDYLLLSVQKGTGTADTYVNVKEIPITESHKALDSDSIYYATDYSPVYWFKDGGKIQFAPDSANVTNKAVRYYRYTKQVLSALDTTVTGFPLEAMPAVTYLAASDMLRSALHTFSEDEAPEEYAQWKVHADELAEQYLKEMQILKQVEGSQE
jgi:hypothetical protein